MTISIPTTPPITTTISTVNTITSKRNCIAKMASTTTSIAAASLEPTLNLNWKLPWCVFCQSYFLFPLCSFVVGVKDAKNDRKWRLKPSQQVQEQSLLWICNSQYIIIKMCNSRHLATNSPFTSSSPITNNPFKCTCSQVINSHWFRR